MWNRFVVQHKWYTDHEPIDKTLRKINLRLRLKLLVQQYSNSSGSPQDMIRAPVGARLKIIHQRSYLAPISFFISL